MLCIKERADQILRLLDDTKARMIDDPQTGRLTIGAIPTIALYFLSQILRRFAMDSPNVQIEVVEEPTTSSIKRCADGSVDLALLALPIQADQFHAEMLFREELKVVMAASHPLASRERLSLTDIQNEPFVLLNEAHCLTQDTLSFCTRHTFVPIVTAEIHQLLTVQELVRLGQGISLIPEMAARMDHPPPNGSIAH